MGGWQRLKSLSLTLFCLQSFTCGHELWRRGGEGAGDGAEVHPRELTVNLIITVAFFCMGPLITSPDASLFFLLKKKRKEKRKKQTELCSFQTGAGKLFDWRSRSGQGAGAAADGWRVSVTHRTGGENTDWPLWRTCSRVNGRLRKRRGGLVMFSSLLKWLLKRKQMEDNQLF